MQYKPEALLASAIAFIKEQLAVDDISETTTWEDLQDKGMDSLDMVEVLTEIEMQCNCSIDDAWVESLEARPEACLKEMAEIISDRLNG